MANIRPFKAIRPRHDLAEHIAALPYDVYSSEEARAEVNREPYSFLRVDRAETLMDENTDMYSEAVYQKAHDTLWQMVREGELLQDTEECYYIYELVMDGRMQTGIAACADIDDYLNNIIKKHENTREEKEIDRVRHVDICNAQTGPIFLAYRAREEIDRIVSHGKEAKPLYSFTARDGIRHRIWKISEQEAVRKLQDGFAQITDIYIADGHHRCASAVRVGLDRRKTKPDYDGEEEFNRFLSVLFPDNQLMIMDYNRVAADLNGHSKAEFLELAEECFKVTDVGETAYHPQNKGEIGMYLDGHWYRMEVKKEYASSDPVESLDVAVLQERLLGPVLGIDNPKTSKRIEFIGGIRGLEELRKRVDSGAGAAFAMYPPGMEELFAVSDAGLLMPPKSTWFEPKLRSGLLIHSLKEER